MATEIQLKRDGRGEPWRRRDPIADQSAAAHMAAGLMIMGVGVLLALGRFGIVATGGWPHLWPLLLIGLGLGRLFMRRLDGTRHGGALLLIGVWLLLNELHIWRVTASWPLLLVVCGVTIVWNAVMVPARRPELRDESL